MITMLLGGLWHGAAWNFVLWGFYHGMLLSVHRVWTYLRERSAVGGMAPAPLTAAAVQRRPSPLTSAAKIGVFFCSPSTAGCSSGHVIHQVVEFTRLIFTHFGSLNYGAAIPRLSALAGIRCSRQWNWPNTIWTIDIGTAGFRCRFSACLPHPGFPDPDGDEQ